MILVNNRDHIEWEKDMTVARLLQKCGFTARQLNVFVNGRLIRRDDFAAPILRDGDQVRVIHHIGGG